MDNTLVAQNISILVDGQEVTSNLGGMWNVPPGTLDPYLKLENLDLTPFIKEGQFHEVTIQGDLEAWVEPLLYVKSIISR